MIKKYNKTIVAIGIYILLIFLISILNYLFLSINISKYILFISTILFTFLMSFKQGRKRISKGYLGGLKISLIIIVLFNSINLLFINNKYDLKMLIYYVIIIMVSILASIIGINKKVS